MRPRCGIFSSSDDVDVANSRGEFSRMLAMHFPFREDLELRPG